MEGLFRKCLFNLPPALNDFDVSLCSPGDL